MSASFTEDEKKRYDEWFASRPPVVQEVIKKFPPLRLYRFKSSKKECFILSYDEGEDEGFPRVVLTVQKTGRGGALSEMGLGELDKNQVFGVDPDELEYIPEDGKT